MKIKVLIVLKFIGLAAYSQSGICVPIKLPDGVAKGIVTDPQNSFANTINPERSCIKNGFNWI